MMHRLIPVLPCVLLACTSTPASDVDDTDAPLGTCDVSGGMSHWLVTELRWGRVVDGVSDGFDLDGQTGNGSCSGDDLAAPDGRSGIDNAFGTLLPILEVTEFNAAEYVISELIRTGEILVVGALAGLDDPVDDDCVGFSVERGLGAPMLGTDGDPLSLQTIDLDTTFEAPMFPEVQVVNGSVEGRPISMDLPIEFLDARMLFELRDGGIRMDLHEDGTASGVIAGGLIVDDVVETILSVGVAPELKISQTP